jgi:uncharacterized protein YkwD
MRRLWLLGTLAVGGCFIFDDPTQDDPPGTSGGSVDDDSIPAVPYCMDVVTWPAESIEFEEDVLVLVNEARAAGATCGGVAYSPAGELTMNGSLRCAARVHSEDMATRGFFDHVNPDGDDPFVRMEAAGFRYSLAGENIAAGQRTPDEVMQGWLASPGHCMNIMEPGFTHFGAGVHFGGDETLGVFWTQTFGSPI